MPVDIGDGSFEGVGALSAATDERWRRSGGAEHASWVTLFITSSGSMRKAAEISSQEKDTPWKRVDVRSFGNGP